MSNPPRSQHVRQLIHQMLNELEIISGSAHLIGLNATLTESDRSDLERIIQSVKAIHGLTRALDDGASIPGQ